MSPGSNVVESKKRKRANPVRTTDIDRDDDDNVLHLKPLGESVRLEGKALELVPRLLIPASGLVLPSTGVLDCDLNDAFEGHVTVLEGRSDIKEKDAERIPKVLIATTRDQSTAYAIEKIHVGVYNVRVLPGWSFVGDAAASSVKRPKPLVKKDEAALEEDRLWWDRAAASAPASAKEISNSSKRSQSVALPRNGAKYELVGSLSRPKLITPPSTDAYRDHGSNNQAQEKRQERDRDAEAETETQDEIAIVSWEDVFVALRKKYLDALYISRTPLAYFAKGPLTRARRSEFSEVDSLVGKNVQSLFTDLILNISMSDKKYSSALPDFINEIPAGVTECDMHAGGLASLHDTMKRSRKRKRLSKNGLFPSEEEYVCQWWLEKENTTEVISMETSHEARIKSSLAEQRTRETQLQVMVVLESLIAQGAKSAEPTAKENVEPSRQVAGMADRRSKKPTDLHALLDILVDRLCIWQTTQDEGASLFSNKSKGNTGNNSLQVGKSNALQDFCTEVLVPFYAARLPKIFASLCQKMGTIGVTSPARPALKRALSGLPSKTHAIPQSQIKPGSAVQRRALKRVATEGDHARRTPSLARSSTDVSAFGIKREQTATDLLLQDVPMYKPSTTLQDRRYSQREVDIAAISKATKVKLGRKAFLEQELASAIHVLKKPNGRAAVHEFVEFADERNASSGRSTSKRKREPIRNNGVHVKATPRAHRWRTTGHDEAQARVRGANNATSAADRTSGDADEAPPSSNQKVPSTSRRLPTEQLLPATYSAWIVNPAFRIEATPMKQRSDGGRLAAQQSPASMRGTMIEGTPSRGAAGKTMLLSPRMFMDQDKDDDGEEDELGGPSPVPPRFMTTGAGRVADTPVKTRASFLAPKISTLPSAVGTTPTKSLATLRQLVGGHRAALLASSVPGSSVAAGTDATGIQEPDATERSAAGAIASSRQQQQQQQHRRCKGDEVNEDQNKKEEEIEDEEEQEEDVYKALGWDNEDDLI